MLDRTTPPNTYGFGKMNVPAMEQKTLSNGIKLNILRDSTNDVIRFNVLSRGGKYETPKVLLPEIMLSLLRKGTAHHTGEEIANILDFNGSWFGGTISDHHVKLTLSSLVRNFSTSLAILFELLTEPIFPENELDICKQQLVEETKVAQQRTRVLALNRFNAIMYGENHPFGKCVTPELIQSIEIEDIRNFHKTFFSPENFEFFITGNISDETINLIADTFEKLKSTNEALSIEYNQQSMPNDPVLEIVNKADAVQSSVIIGIDAPARSHPDYIPLRILTYQLGGYFGSRLNLSLREEKGFTYGISAGLMGHRDFSSIQISTDCATHFSQQVVDGIRTELQKLCDEPISEEEMKILRAHMTSDIIKMIDSSFSITDYHILKLTLDFPDKYFENQLSTIETITAQELKNIAQKYLNTKKIITVLAGDDSQLKNLT